MSSVLQVVFLPLQAEMFAAAIAVTLPTEQTAGALPKLDDVKVATLLNSAVKTIGKPLAVNRIALNVHDETQFNSLAALVAKMVVPCFKVKLPVLGAKAKLTVTSVVK